MRILFLAGLYPHEHLEQFNRLSSGQIQMAADNFQWAIVDGLSGNDVTFEVISFPFLPTFPFRYKSLYTSGCDLLYRNAKVGTVKGYCAAPFFKSLSIVRRAYSAISKWIKENGAEELVIISYTPYVPFIKAVRKIKKKYPAVRYATIITDLIDDQGSFVSRFSTYKRLQAKWEYKAFHKLTEYVDKYVLLTKAMEERIPEAAGKSIVMEGLAPDIIDDVQVPVKDANTIFYAGTFQPYSGLKELIEAFRKTRSSDYVLKLCGHGALTDYVKAQAEQDARIRYMGMVSHAEVVRFQKEASVLVNPRKPDQEITRFSFPSKTIEYMMSGTPMIGYRLEGIPEEYYRHMYIPDTLSVESMAELIDEVLSMPQSFLDAKALSAKEFVIGEKRSVSQVEKIIRFLGA